MNYDNVLLQQANKHMENSGVELSDIEKLSEQKGIDNVSDWYGKALLFIEVLKTMDEKDANEIMHDTLGMMQDEINEMLED